LLILAVVLALAGLWLGWRYIALSSCLKHQAVLLRAVTNGEKSISDLPEDFSTMEYFSIYFPSEGQAQ